MELVFKSEDFHFATAIIFFPPKHIGSNGHILFPLTVTVTVYVYLIYPSGGVGMTIIAPSTGRTFPQYELDPISSPWHAMRPGGPPKLREG